jgi:Rrf2 family protein
MISKKTKYALKALVYLAGEPSNAPVLIADLAREENIPRKFLEFILLSLRKGGVLQSKVGKGGGYYLSSPPSAITLGAVIRILEGDLAPVQCLSVTNYARCEECGDEATCGIRLVMVDVDSALSRVLDGLTLADMLERSKTARNNRDNVVDFAI